MKHITEEYGQPCNLLVLSREEYHMLDAFLRLEGVRIRRCKEFGSEVTIQAENPFMRWLAHSANLDYPVKKAYEQAKDDMSDRAVACYKW